MLRGNILQRISLKKKSKGILYKMNPKKSKWEGKKYKIEKKKKKQKRKKEGKKEKEKEKEKEK